jgi:hypothetical protein
MKWGKGKWDSGCLYGRFAGMQKLAREADYENNKISQFGV